MTNTPPVSTTPRGDTFLAGASPDRPKARRGGEGAQQTASSTQGKPRDGTGGIFSEAQQRMPSFDPLLSQWTAAPGSVPAKSDDSAGAHAFEGVPASQNFTALQDQYLRNLSDATGEKLEVLQNRLGLTSNPENDSDMEAIKAAAQY